MKKRLWPKILVLFLLSTVFSCLNVISENKAFIPDNWYADPFISRLGPLRASGVDTWEQRDDLQEPERPDLLVLVGDGQEEIYWQKTEQSNSSVKVSYSETTQRSANPHSPPVADRSSELSILNYGPQRLLEPGQEFLFSVTFDQFMVEEGEIGKLRPSVSFARIEPPVQGLFTWYNRQSITWMPTEPLEKNQDYQWVFQKDIPIGQGPKLSEVWSFPFYLSPLQVISLEPASVSQYSTPFGPIPMPDAQVYRIRFNRMVDPAFLQEFIQVLVNGVEQAFVLQSASESENRADDPTDELILELKQEPSEQSEIRILFSAQGRADAEAFAPLEEADFFFRTLEPFRVVSLDSSSSDFPELEDQDIRNVFLNCSHLLLEDNDLGQFQWKLGDKLITPTKILQKGKSVYFALPEGQPGDRLSLQIGSGFRDFYGRSVANIRNFTLELRSGSIKHSLAMQGDYLWPNHWGLTLPLQYRNLRAVALSWFSRSDMFSGDALGEVQTSLNLEDRPFNQLAQTSLPAIPVEKSRASGFWEIRWNARLGGSGTGYPLSWESGSFNLQKTSIGLIAKAAFDRILVHVFDLETAQALPGAQIRIYNDNGTILQGISDQNGWSDFYLEPGVFASNFRYSGRNSGSRVHIEAEYQGDKTQLRMDPQSLEDTLGPFPYVFPDHAAQTRNRVFLVTDKTNYLYGQKIYFKGYHWEQNHQGYRPTRMEEATVELWRVPQNQQVALQTVKPGFSGSFDHYFQVGRELPPGRYELRYTNGLRTLGRQSLFIGTGNPGESSAIEQTSMDESALLPISPDKWNYSIGDLVKLRGSHGLQQGRHLLFIQQESILSYQSYLSQGEEIQINLPLNKDHFPGIMLTIFSTYPRLVDPETQEVVQESATFAQEIPLTVQSPVMDLQVNILSSRKPFNPAEEGYLGVKVSSDGFSISNAEVTIMVVPEDRETPTHPNQFFYQSQNFPYGVLSLSSHQKVYGSISEGGTFPGLIADQSSNPSASRGHSPRGETLFFLPKLKTNDQGIASAALEFPRNIQGQWKIIALVNKEGRFGLSERKLDIQPELAGWADLPVFLNQRDRIKIPFSMVNYSSTERLVNVSVDTRGLSFPHGETMSAVIPPGTGHTFVFTAEALEAGSYPVVFRDFGNGGEVYASQKIRIHTAPEIKTPFTVLNFEGGEAQAGVFLQEEDFSGSGGISLIIGNSPGLSLLPTLERLIGSWPGTRENLRAWVALSVGQDSHREYLEPAFPPVNLDALELFQDQEGRLYSSIPLDEVTSDEEIDSSDTEEGLDSLEVLSSTVPQELTLLMLHAHTFAGRQASAYRSKINLQRALNYLFQVGTTDIESRKIDFWDIWGHYLLAKAKLISGRTLARFEDQQDDLGIAELSLLSRTYLVLGDFYRARMLFQKAKDYLSTSGGKVSFKVSYPGDPLWRDNAGELGPFLSLARLLGEGDLFKDAVRSTLEDHLIKVHDANPLEDFWSFVSLAEDIPPFVQSEDGAEQRISLGDRSLIAILPLFQEIDLSFNQEPLNDLGVESLRRLTLDMGEPGQYRGLIRQYHSQRAEDLKAVQRGYSLLQVVLPRDFQESQQVFAQDQKLIRMVHVESLESQSDVLLRIPRLPFASPDLEGSDSRLNGQVDFNLSLEEGYWLLRIPDLPAGQTSFWQELVVEAEGHFILPPAEIRSGVSRQENYGRSSGSLVKIGWE